MNDFIKQAQLLKDDLLKYKIDKNYKKHILSAAKRFSQIGEIDHAEQFAKSYIEKTNNDPEGYNTLGKLYSKSGDVDKAIVSYNKGLKLNKDNAMSAKRANVFL